MGTSTPILRELAASNELSLLFTPPLYGILSSPKPSKYPYFTAIIDTVVATKLGGDEVKRVEIPRSFLLGHQICRSPIIRPGITLNTFELVHLARNRWSALRFAFKSRSSNKRPNNGCAGGSV